MKCGCDCKPKFCKSGQIQNKDTCECVSCPSIICAPSMIWNANTCKCELKTCTKRPCWTEWSSN
jgi:hypothetical protein